MKLEILYASLGWATSALLIAYIIVSLVLVRPNIFYHRKTISVLMILLDIVKTVLSVMLATISGVITGLISIVCWGMIFYWNILSERAYEKLKKEKNNKK